MIEVNAVELMRYQDPELWEHPRNTWPGSDILDTLKICQLAHCWFLDNLNDNIIKTKLKTQ